MHLGRMISSVAKTRLTQATLCCARAVRARVGQLLIVEASKGKLRLQFVQR
jgi:hypothetical protein